MRELIFKAIFVLIAVPMAITLAKGTFDEIIGK
jgi:hypothetical protein